MKKDKLITKIFMYIFCITFIISYWDIPYGSIIRYADLILIQVFAICDIIIYKKYKDIKKIYINKKVLFSVGIMFLLMIVSIFTSINIKESIIKTISIFDLLLLVFYIFPLILKDFSFDEILKIISNSIFIMLTISTAVFRDSYSFSGDPNRFGNNVRYLAGFVYPSILGNFATIEILITIKFIYNYIEEKISNKNVDIKNLILYSIQIILSAYLIYASNTRTAGCVAIIFIFILLYKTKFNNKAKKIIKSICLILVLIFIVLLGCNVITISLIDNILSYRLTLIGDAFEKLINNNKLLFGIGAFRNSSLEEVDAILIDNGYINFVYQYGIISFIPLVIFLLNIFIDLKKNEKSVFNNDVIFMETFFIAFLIYSLFENNLLNISSFLAVVTYTLLNIVFNKLHDETLLSETDIEKNKTIKVGKKYEKNCCIDVNI